MAFTPAGNAQPSVRPIFPLSSSSYSAACGAPHRFGWLRGVFAVGLLLDFYAMRFYHWGYAMAFTPAGNAQPPVRAYLSSILFLLLSLSCQGTASRGPLRGIDGRAFFPAGRGSRPAARRPGRLRPGHHSHYRPGLPVVRALSLSRRGTVSAARFYHLHRRRRARRTAHDRLLPPPSSHGRRRARTEPTTPSLPPPPHGKRRARTGAHDPVSSPLIPRQAASEDGSPRHRLFPPSLCKPTRAAPPDGRWWPAIPPVGRFGAPRSGWGRETPRLATLLKRSRAGHPRLPPPPPRLAAWKGTVS